MFDSGAFIHKVKLLPLNIRVQVSTLDRSTTVQKIKLSKNNERLDNKKVFLFIKKPYFKYNI
jgi:hypothetical protein